MEMLFAVVLGTLCLAITCISYSTWTTVGDLRSIVADAEASTPRDDSGTHDWHEFASRAIGHIEHLSNGEHVSSHSGGVPSSLALLQCCIPLCLPLPVEFPLEELSPAPWKP